MALGASRSVGKKWVSRLLGLGGRGRLDGAAGFLGGSVERQEGAREGNVETAGRHCASVVVGVGEGGEKGPRARMMVFEASTSCFTNQDRVGEAVGAGVTDDSSGSPVVRWSRMRASVGCQMTRPIIEKDESVLEGGMPEICCELIFPS